MQLTKNTKFHNRFRLVEKKGSGSFGEVWLAHDEQLNMEVAIKVYISLDERGINDFKSEYRNTFGLSHPNLLHAYHFDLCDNRPYLVMPYCPDSAVSLVGCADEATLWRFLRDVASGLAYLHRMDIVHHDIKPDNVLIDRDGSFLITDFGISTRLRSTLQRNSLRDAYSAGPSGSLPYMAPELFDLSAGAVLATDIWALGATLYEMASGELPFFGQGGAMLLKGATVGYPQLPYSKGMIDTIIQCLAKEPWDRPTAKELAERAQAVMDGYPYQGISEPPIAPQEIKSNVYGSGDKPVATSVTPRKKSKTWLWVLLVILLAVILLAGGGFAAWLLTRGGGKPNNDMEFFAYCQNNPTIENYRSYVKKFPQGEFIGLANNWIEHWVNDSIAQASEKPDYDYITPAPDFSLQENKRDEKKTEKQELKKESQMKPETTNNTSIDAAQQTPPKDDISNGLGIIMNSKGEDKTASRPIPSQPSSKDTSPANGETNPDLNQATTGGLGLTASGNTEEEKMYNEILTKTKNGNLTIEDCEKYLRRWYKNDVNAEHWEFVIGKFYNLYFKQIKVCTTVEEIDAILSKHDSLMKELHLAGSNIDKQMINYAQAQKKRLEKMKTGRSIE